MHRKMWFFRKKQRYPFPLFGFDDTEDLQSVHSLSCIHLGLGLGVLCLSCGSVELPRFPYQIYIYIYVFMYLFIYFLNTATMGGCGVYLLRWCSLRHFQRRVHFECVRKKIRAAVYLRPSYHWWNWNGALAQYLLPHRGSLCDRHCLWCHLVRCACLSRGTCSSQLARLFFLFFFCCCYLFLYMLRHPQHPPSFLNSILVSTPIPYRNSRNM